MSDLNYNENSIDELGQIEATRLRPQSIGFESESHLYVEQLANSIDEAREGYGDVIETTKYKDDSISVRDYGRSIPLDYNSKTGKFNWQSIFMRMWAGGKYSNNNTDSNYKQSLGTNGAGNFGTCATSEFLEVWSHKGKECHNIRFEQGEIVKEFNKYEDDTQRGTKVHFKPDIEVFGHNLIEDGFIEDTLKRQAIVNGGIKFEYNNQKKDYTKEFYYENGIKDFIMETSQGKEISQLYTLENETFIKSKPQDFHAKYEINFIFNNEINLMEYYHNSSFLPNGGLPEKVVKNAMTYMFDKYIKDNNMYKKGEKIKFEDIQDSLIVVFSSGSTTSIFSDQTKKSIEHKKLQEVITEDFKNYLEIIFAENKLEFDKVANQCLINMRANSRAEKSKQEIKKKLQSTSKNGLSVKMEGVKDCDMRKSSLEERILLVDEGVSANSTIVKSFDSRIMGAMGLRGRFINALKSNVLDVLKNQPAYTLIQALGCGVEIPYEERKNFSNIKTFDLEKLKYGKVGILCDSDAFGKAITLALITFFYKFMPTLVKQGRIYIVRSPRFWIHTKNEDFYAYNDKEKDCIINNLKSKNIKYDIGIKKGLGEFSQDEFWRYVLSEEAREKTFIQLQYKETQDELINYYFNTLMGEDIEERKKYIQENITHLDLNDMPKIIGEDVSRLNKREIPTALQEEFIPYASEIIVNNLPSIDGLLPVQRRVLWALHRNKVTPDKNYIKLLKAGSMAMSYYVFGDMPLYKAMKNMANDGINHLYLDPKGSFGDKQSKKGVGASPRYIECRLDKYGVGLLNGVDKHTVPMIRNFDDTKFEPTVLPSEIPNVLVNTSQSIAVGLASKMPGHNIIDVCDGVIEYIKTNDIDKTIEIIKCPDMPSRGNIIYDKSKFDKIYKTGRGSFSIVGKYRIQEEKKHNVVSIYEIPYETYTEVIEESLRKSYDKGLFKEVIDIHDASGRQGVQLDIYLKKNADIKNFIKKLRKLTPFECDFSCNFTLLDLDWKTPKLMTLEDIVSRWITHRVNCIKNETQYDINKNKIELNKLYGLRIINRDLDKAIKLIRSSKTEKEAIEKLIKCFSLNQEQSEYVSTIRLVNINQDWIFKKIKNIEDLEDTNNLLEEYINSENMVKSTIIEQLQQVKKQHGKPRMSEILYEDKNQEVSNECLVEDYNTIIQLTDHGYFKKIKATSITSKATDKVKDDDKIISTINSTNKSEILFFTDKHNVYKKYGYEFEDTKQSNLGDYLPNILDLEDNEKVLYICSVEDYSKGYIFATFNTGKHVKLAKIDVKAYQTKQKRSKLAKAYSANAKLLDIVYSDTDINVMCLTSQGKCAIYNSTNIDSKTSKSINGNNIFKISDDDSLVGVLTDVNESTKFEITTSKDKELLYTIGDNYDENRTHLEYFSRSGCGAGAFLINLKNKKEKITKLSLTE